METEKREILKLALEKCNLYLDKRIISRSIYRKYVEFIIDTIFQIVKLRIFRLFLMIGF